ncbi:zinc finger CCCH domain-containing protein 3-like [Branchiostoma floridae]|uniref:Zinc finger CCCH domain-containing protein 3 n=1 Tax=Branchiostoma floridae TaxID=7739 RepID=A0A9J7MT10_BRAFL|nr:zinc finger CCCH domain-containing protein 3-like [Branchiostoma floridae]
MADREREVLEKQIRCLSNLISTHKQLSAQEQLQDRLGQQTARQLQGRRGQQTSAPVASSRHARHRYTWSAPVGSTNTHPTSACSSAVSSTRTTAAATAHKLVRQTPAAPVSAHMTVTTATTGFTSGRIVAVPVRRPSSRPAGQGSGHPSSGAKVIRSAAASQGSSQYRWTPAVTSTANAASGLVQRTAVTLTNPKTTVPPANTILKTAKTNLQKPTESGVKPPAHPVTTSVSVPSQPVSTGRVVATKYSLKKVSPAQLSLSKTSTPRAAASAGVRPSTGRVVSSRFRLRKAGTEPGSLQAHSRTVGTELGPPQAHSRAVQAAGSSGVVCSRYRLNKVSPGGTNKSGAHRVGGRGKTPSPKVLTSKHKLRRQAGRGSSMSKTSPSLSKRSPAGFVTAGKYKLRAKRGGTPGVRRGGGKSAGAVVSRYRLVKPRPAADTDRPAKDTGTAKFPSQEQLRWTRSSSSAVMAEQHRVTDTRRGRYVTPGTVSTPGLGRRVSRYKIVKSSTSAAGSMSKRTRPDPRTTRYYVKTASGKLLVKGGVVYKLSSSRLTRASHFHSHRYTLSLSQVHTFTLTGKPAAHKDVKVNIRGERFLLDASGKTLTRVKETAGSSTNEAAGTRPGKEPFTPRGVSRVVIRGVPFIRTAPGKLVRSSATNKVQEMASRAVQRSILTSQTARYRKTNRQAAARQYCMFYNRFGRCNRGNDCPYIHDPDKVAVCTRFLRGTCPVNDCPFSHKVSPDKMPVCSYFLRGVCNRDDCPYSHVYVSRNAQVCQDFVHGYCPRGKQCTKKHTLDCPDFSRTGSCPRGGRCRMVHRRRREKRRHAEAGEETRGEDADGREETAASHRPAEGDPDSGEEHQQESGEDSREESGEESGEEPPRKVAKLPSFISLRDSMDAGSTEQPGQGQEKLPAFPSQSGSQSESRARAEQVLERLQIRPRFLARPRRGGENDGTTGSAEKDGSAGE